MKADTVDPYDEYVTIIMLSQQIIGTLLERSQIYIKKLQHAGNAGARNALKTAIYFCMNTNTSFRDACSIANLSKHCSSHRSLVSLNVHDKRVPFCTKLLPFTPPSLMDELFCN